MMKKNSEELGLLKKSGYSDKAIEYFINKLNVGTMENPSVSCAYTGPCGDTMQIYLKINDGQITDAKFQAIGCAAAHASGSALMEIVRGKSLEEAEELRENEGLPVLCLEWEHSLSGIAQLRTRIEAFIEMLEE